MNGQRENSSEKSLEKVAGNKPVSVYSVNFTEGFNNFAEKRIAPRKTAAGRMTAQNSFSRIVFKRRNAVAVAAILAIGVLHFVFQMSFIRTEVSKSSPAIEVPPVKVEPVRAAPAAAPVEFKAKKINAELPSKNLPATKQRQSEIAPARPQPKKPVETRAERLRRAERILTGV